MPWNRGDPSSDVAIHFLFSSWPRKWNPCLLVQGKKIIVSTGSIRWILWFSVRYAAVHREIFSVNALRGKQQQLGSPNLRDIFIGG